MGSTLLVTFSWGVSDANGDTLTCTLDVDGDTNADYTINDCANTTAQAHTYATAGDYTARLTINDGNGGMVDQSVTITVTEKINKPPAIDDFGVSAMPGYTNSATTMTWNVSDEDNDTLTCTLDVNDDGAVDYTIDDCANNTSQAHTFATEGAYVVRLTVSDGAASPVQGEQTITVILPLAMVVSVDQVPVAADKRLIYTVTVSNRSPVPVNEVSALLRVPTGLSFTGTNHTEPDAGDCPYNACNPTAEAVWDLDTLVAGESRTITINALVDTGLLDGAAITALFTLRATGMNDVSLAKLVEVHNTPSADLALSASTDPVVPGEVFTFQVDVGNISDKILLNGQLRATLPTGVSVSSVSDGGVDQGNGEVVWDIPDLIVGASLRRTITVIGDNGLVAGQILQATVQLTHDGGQELDDSSQFAVSVTGSTPPVSATIAAAPDPIASGGILVYTITASNDSDRPVNAVNIMFRVPAGLSFVATTDADPDAGGCAYNACNSTAEAVWGLDTLAVGASQTITINATVASGLDSGTLISVPVRVTATELQDTINLQHTTVIGN